jgi:hypothetical protein
MQQELLATPMFHFGVLDDYHRMAVPMEWYGLYAEQEWFW